MTGSPLRRWRFRQLIRHNLNINGISPLLPTSNKVVSSINRCCPHSIGKSAARGRVADKNKTKTVYFDRSALPCRPQGHVRQARFCPEPTGISLAQSPKFLGFKDQFVQTEIPLTRTSAECQDQPARHLELAHKHSILHLFPHAISPTPAGPDHERVYYLR